MVSFSDLKRSRKTSLQKLSEEVDKITNPQYGKDERFWSASTDKVGNGSAVIRFLPSQHDDIPFVRYWDHGFKGPTGRWYIEKCLTTLGQPDPVVEHCNMLWKAGDEDTARERKRRLHYVSNILVVKDPANAENEGQVFLFNYGKKIFDKLNDIMNPEFEDQKAVNPFDPWEGANFHLRIRKKDGFTNYDASSFDSQGSISEDEGKLKELFEKTHALSEFIDPKDFKSYDELKRKLDFVLNTETTSPRPSLLTEPREEKAPVRAEALPRGTSVNEDDDEMTELQRLLNEED